MSVKETGYGPHRSLPPSWDRPCALEASRQRGGTARLWPARPDIFGADWAPSRDDARIGWAYAGALAHLPRHIRHLGLVRGPTSCACFARGLRVPEQVRHDRECGQRAHLCFATICCFATIFRNRQKAEKRKWGLVFPPAPTAPSGSGLRTLAGLDPFRSQPSRARSLIAQASLLCFGPRSSAVQRPFLGCWSLTLTLRPVRHRHLFRRLSSASRFCPPRRAFILVSLRLSLGFLLFGFPPSPSPEHIQKFSWPTESRQR